MCAQWKSEAIKLEEELAQKQKANIVQAVQDRFALSEEKVDPDSIQSMYALSFYVTKTVLVGPKRFWFDQIDLDMTIMIWS